MRFWTKRIAGILIILLLFGCKAQPLKKSQSEQVGISKDHLSLLNGIIEEAIQRKDFPGAVVMVGRKGKVVFDKAYGESQWVPQHRAMTTSMIFDLASITKPMATATSIMILVERGKISLEEKVKDYVPDFAPYVDEKGNSGEDARLWHLLTHTSGLPSYTDAAEAEKILGKPCPVENLVTYIGGLIKTDPPGQAFHYSCLDYITLAYIVKKVSGQTIAEFAEKNIFKPLNMKHTFYVPPQKYHNLCVPTEVIEGKSLVGVVHDPLARLQSGISGNAGLFSTADDLAVFAQMMLRKGEFKGTRILSPLTVERMTAVFPKASFAGRSLGWDLDSSYATNGGEIFGSSSYGHTGYTGTSIWIDPETETFVIFLTNRIHPDDKGSIISMRSKVANVVASAIIQK